MALGSNLFAYKLSDLVYFSDVNQTEEDKDQWKYGTLLRNGEPHTFLLIEGSVCLDTGECGIDFGMRCYGGFPAYGSLRQSCPKGKWSD